MFGVLLMTKTSHTALSRRVPSFGFSELEVWLEPRSKKEWFGFLTGLELRSLDGGFPNLNFCGAHLEWSGSGHGSDGQDGRGDCRDLHISIWYSNDAVRKKNFNKYQ